MSNPREWTLRDEFAANLAPGLFNLRMMTDGFSAHMKTDGDESEGGSGAAMTMKVDLSSVAHHYDEIAMEAYLFADALIAARSKNTSVLKEALRDAAQAPESD